MNAVIAESDGGSAADFDLARHLPARLGRLSTHIAGRIARLCRSRFSLSPPEWRIVAILGQQGAMSANAVVVQTAVDKVRVSRGISRLLDGGLITRDSDPSDRRRAILKLTSAGQETYRQIVPLVQEVEAEMMADLSGAERDVLEQTLTQIEVSLR